MHSVAHVGLQRRFVRQKMHQGEIGGVQAAESEWLTAQEAALYLRVKTRTVLLWVRQKKIRGYVLSGTKRRVWRFRRADLDAMLLAQDMGVLCSTSPSVLTKGEAE